MAQSNIRVGDIEDVNGEVTIAGGDIYKGFTAEQVSVLIKQITSTFEPKKFDGRCPYKGLDVFEEEDAELFFGREKLADDLINRVKGSRTVFITGPSGSGKSSLVRAGLLPALKNGAIKNSKSWFYETIKPGRDPLESLATAFSRLKSPELANYFRGHVNKENILHECAESVLSNSKNQRLVLFIDQFEEAFTQVGKDKTEAFINILANATTVENGRIIILFSMRSDFVSNCATYPQLNELLNQQFIQIGAMQPDELVSAIAQPALRVGLRIDPDLIAQIINDMQGEPGALPLMQFALKDLFDSQQEKGGAIALTLNDYLQHGGIHKALERHADDAFAKLNETEQELARSIFSGLIEIGRGTQDTRRTALFDELVPANTKTETVEAIVQKLADARLVTTDEQAGKDIVTISHEKLIDAWPWLKKLVNENREVIALQNEIASDAKEWEEHKRDPSYLYTGARLINAREQMEARKLALSGLVQEFVQKGITRQRRRQIALVSGVSVIIALLSFAAIIFNNQANVNANLAQRNEAIANTAQAANTEAVAQRATAQAASTLAVEQQYVAETSANEAIARQLAAQAQSLVLSRSSKQTTAALLVIQSLKMFPSSEGTHILLNNNFSARPIARMAHESSVDFVTFSPNGKYILSMSGQTARVWEATTGKEVARMTHDQSVNSVVFDLSGKYVVSGSSDNTVRVWESTTGKEVERMIHDGIVYSVAFSPDGKYVISGSDDNTARVWEAASGKEIARMTHDDWVYLVTFSPDGKYVISEDSQTTRIWEPTTGKEIFTLDFSMNVVTFSLDGKYLATSGGGALCVLEAVTWWKTITRKEPTCMSHDQEVSSFAFSPDGEYLVSGSWDSTARVWEVATGKEVARMTHDGPVLAVAFSPDGKYVVSGSWDSTARAWEAATGKEVARMTHDGSVLSVAFSPDGKYVISGSEDYTARVWEVAIDKEAARIIYDSSIYQVAFSPDGKYLVGGGTDTTIGIWEVVTGKEVSRLSYDNWNSFIYGYILSVVYSPDGQNILSIGCDHAGALDLCFEGSVRIWNAVASKEIAHMTHVGGVYSAAFSPDGKYVVSGGCDEISTNVSCISGSARVWETITGKEVARKTYEGEVKSVAFSPDGKYVVSGGDFTVYVWEATTGKEITHMTHDFYVNSVAFSPDGKYVVSGSQDRTARMWEVSTGKELVRMIHDDEVNSVAFSPDGKYVISRSQDNSARVWDATTGKEIARMTHESSVTSVAFSPDSKYVVSGSADKTTRVWEVATGKEVARMIFDRLVHFVTFSPNGEYVLSSGYNTARIWMWRVEDLITDACSRATRNLTRAEWNQYVGDALPYQAVCENLPIEPEETSTP